MPVDAPQMPLISLVLYILYYTTATTMTSAEGKRKAFKTIWQNVSLIVSDCQLHIIYNFILVWHDIRNKISH